jgi:phage-related protein
MITAYEPWETSFTHNGIIPLLPTAATVTEELNGIYELSLIHPADPAGRWSKLNENFIICAPTPSGNQLFRIYRPVKRFNSTVTVNARHISYDAALDIISAKAQSITPDAAIKQIYAASPSHGLRFTVSSDIPGAVDIDYHHINPIHALMERDKRA